MISTQKVLKYCPSLCALVKTRTHWALAGSGAENWPGLVPTTGWYLDEQAGLVGRVWRAVGCKTCRSRQPTVCRLVRKPPQGSVYFNAGRPPAGLDPASCRVVWKEPKGPSTLATLLSHRWPRFCGGDIYSRRKPLFSSFGEHTAVCGSSVRQAVARPRHRQSVCIHNIHVAATCRPSVLGSATMRGHMWLNKVASVLGP